MTIKIFCKFCAGRCGMLIEYEGSKIVSISGNPEHPVSRGWSCARGKAAMVTYYKGNIELMNQIRG